MLILLAVSAMAEDGTTRLVADLRDDVSLLDIEEIESDIGESLSFIDVETVDEKIVYIDTTKPYQVLSDLLVHPLVESIEVETQFSIPGELIDQYWGTPPAAPRGDPMLERQWHLTHESIQAPWAWNNTKGGAGVVVAVLDTGMTVTSDTNPAHVDMERARSFVGQPVQDANGHGTHCASTIGEWTLNGISGAGVAPNATILPIKVLSNEGFGGAGGIVAGIDYAREQGADIISMSLGSSVPSPAINGALTRAMDAGVVVVAAAGNSGRNGRDSVGFPGGFDPVIGVGAIGPQGKRAPYSSYGKGLDIMAPGGDKTTGDGGGVWQQTAPRGQDGFYSFQGTSMATPHVAGAVAVLLAEGACPKKDKTRQACMDQLLKSTGTPAPRGDRDREYGDGTINLRAAVEKVRGKHATADAGASLPYPNPAGKYTFLITLLALGLSWLVAKQEVFTTRFTAIMTATAVALSGPLYGLTLVDLDVRALAFLIVPFLEWPEYIVGRGASGFPLWLSPLPWVIPFFVCLPLRPLRPFLIGGLLSACAYLVANTMFGFNHLWWMPGVGATLWLVGSLAGAASMVGTYTEFARLGAEE